MQTLQNNEKKTYYVLAKTIVLIVDQIFISLLNNRVGT